MKIGLYGGTFDPIHCAHLIIAQFIKEELNLSKIIFIPSGIPPHKNVYLPATLRLKMVRLAINDNPDFECSTIEINNTTTNYSVHTIEQIKTELSIAKKDLFFLVGSDNFIDFPKWKNPHKIYQICNVVVFPRDKADFEKTPLEFRKQSIYLDNAPIIEISSTQIRSSIKQNRSIRYLVPQLVEKFIRDEQLYL